LGVYVKSLIIAEKPQAAEKIEFATKVRTLPAVGHLVELENIEKRWSPPYFDVEWRPRKGTVKTLMLMLNALRSASDIIIATDYDAEGQLIALNILRQANVDPLSVKRMKFSSLETEEIEKAFGSPIAFDVNFALSAEARHYLDWYFGKNISKALTLIYKEKHKLMPTRGLTPVGRVQSPTLRFLSEREQEISTFVGRKVWYVKAHGLYNSHRTFEITTLGLDSKEKMEDFISTGLRGKVKAFYEHKYETVYVPPNKDYVMEKCLGLKLSSSLVDTILQDLYLTEYISYPRTSSTKYSTHGISTSKYLERLVDVMPQAKEAIGEEPNEGDQDDIHPAIYPIKPYITRDLRKVVWDIIAEAFVKCHLPPERHKFESCEVEIGGRVLSTSEIPELAEGDHFQVVYSQVHEGTTTPPSRYEQPQVYEYMVKESIGTKDTRSQILGKLLQTYVYETRDGLYVSAKGIDVVNVLNKFCPDLCDVNLTRKFEGYTEQVKEGLKPEQVLDEARKVVTGLVENIFNHRKEISKLMG